MKMALVAPSDRSCAAIARRLGERVAVEVLATCAGPREPWRDYGDPGVVRDGSVLVRRFRSDHPSVPELIARLAAVVASGTAPRELEERWMRERGPYSSALLDHLERCRDEHDVFVFFSLEAATTVFGLPLVRPKAVLVPASGDGPVRRSELLHETLAGASGLVFASEDERRRVHDATGAARPAVVARDASIEPWLEVARRVTGAPGA